MTSVPLLRKESQYTLDKESYDSSIQMEDIYKQKLVNPVSRTGSGISLHASGNGSKRSSLMSSQEPPPSPKINKVENRHSKRMSKLSQHISMQTKYISTQRPKVKRWKLYEGKSKLFLHGRIVTGNDSFTFFLSTLLIIGPCVLLMIFVLPEFNILHTYLFAYGTVFCTASLLKTSWTDPGILPRNLELLPTEIHFNNNENDNGSVELPENTYNGTEDKKYNDHSPYSSTTHLNQNHNQNENNLSSTYPFIAPAKTYIPPMRNIIVNGRIVSQKFCNTCKIYRPPRSFHCSFCDNCVENCDHHCPWTANCIGKRNYRYFYAFISSATFLCLVIFIMSTVFIGRKFNEKKFNYDFDGFMNCITNFPVPFILIVFVVLSLCFVGFLFGYHTYLICKNITTHENIKEIYIPNTNRSYFSTGNAFKNMLLVLFRPVPPSRFAMRQKISVPINTTNPNDDNTPVLNPFLQNPFLQEPSSSSNNNFKLRIDD